jgi:hypothetical protein
MIADIFFSLTVLGWLLISVCITVLTFTAVELRRIITKLVDTIDENAERDYQMSERNYVAIGELRKWQRRSDDDPQSELPRQEG